ncbi:lytic murein transglycosylase B [Janthinobacterium fluminis]|uniref:Lytic murein transglycosylase B n=1 Tax=Janthinobacterium fluminis TaxID=2987524 RepID=A0ABT5JY85_9BURK|nr:lytic murein transglycosylase B [Janthinobacterium fluminis]MDC8757544.1 lytic murein transglycosylase B [Janthinobacterium fluminis]
MTATPTRTTSALILALLLGATPLTQAAGAPAKAAKKVAAKADYEGEYVNFAEWKEVAQFLDDMVRKHQFERPALEALLAKVRYVETTIQLMKPAPPGKPKNWQAYRQRFVEPVRIDAGVQFWNDNADALARAESVYGVPADIIVGIIGVETVYGRNTGRFRVLDALTTLAFAYPDTPTRGARMAFFRGELESALLFARQSNIDPLTLLGSYAGAVGLPQFMPSSILQHAVDFDGDGRVDLRGSAADAIGSVANFLVRHGWQRDLARPFAYPATVSPARAWEGYIGQGLEAKHTQDELAGAGVGSDAPLPGGIMFGLVDLQNGAEATEYWLATANFFAITQYNRSYFYAMSVLDLGRAVRLARGG